MIKKKNNLSFIKLIILQKQLKRKSTLQESNCITEDFTFGELRD